MKISVISKKSADQISSLIDSKFHSKDKVSREVLLLELLGAAVLKKRDIFDTTIYKGFTEFGLVDFYANIMFVFLHKIGLIWKVNSNESTHEDFVFGLLQEKINDITDEITKNKFSKDIWLLL